MLLLTQGHIAIESLTQFGTTGNCGAFVTAVEQEFTMDLQQFTRMQNASKFTICSILPIVSELSGTVAWYNNNCGITFWGQIGMF